MTETPGSCIYLLDGKDRLPGSVDGFNFAVDCGVQLTRCRYAQVNQVVLPKLPQINGNNHTLQIRSAVHGPPITVNLDFGFYNQTSIVNELKQKIDSAFVAAGAADSFTVAFDPKKKTISVTSNNGINFYFVTGTTFQKYAYNVVSFKHLPLSADPAAVGDVTLNSAPIGLIYSRYVNVFSNRLVENTFTPNRTSAQANPSLVAVIPIVDDYVPSDFDVSGQFTGNLISQKTANDAPIMSVVSFGKNLSRIDLRFEDEFGLPLSNALNYGAGYLDSTFNCLASLTLYL
jgi:hypothetical protein